MVDRFQSLNKEKTAKDKLARWKQVEGVLQFNHDFQRVVLDISDISIPNKLIGINAALSPIFGKKCVFKDYDSLTDAMRDAERIEAAHSRFKNPCTSEVPACRR